MGDDDNTVKRRTIRLHRGLLISEALGSPIMSMFHLLSRQTTSPSFLRCNILVVLGLLVLLCSAFPAGAETLVSTLKTPMYPVPLGQSIHVTLADLANSEEGGLVEIFLVDETGTTIADLETHLSKNRAVTLSWSPDALPPNRPFGWVRVVVRVQKDLASDLKTSVTVFNYDPIFLDIDLWCSRVGPSADDPEPEVNCPAWEMNEVTM